jgi:HD-like signal output (HDOD) protein
LPAVANEVLALASNPDTDLRRIASAFQGDAAFAAEVLVLANSPLFGLRSRVHSIVQAVSVLGLERLRCLAITVALRAVIGSGGASLRSSWRHSAACAIVCQSLAELSSAQRDRAYTAGLLHDVGRLGLLKLYPTEIEPFFRCSYADASGAMAAERTLVQVDHVAAGSWLVRTWGFPDELHDVCLHHHEPAAADDSELLRLVKTSCRLAGALGFGALQYKNAPTYATILEEDLPHFPAERVPSEEELMEQITVGLQTFLK